MQFLDDTIPEPERLTPIVQVRLELRSRPGVFLTMAALIELTGLTRIQLTSAIHKLTKRRLIVRRAGARAGRYSDQAYAWRGPSLAPLERAALAQTPARGDTRRRGGAGGAGVPARQGGE
jgi:hypothetical protein